MLAENVLLVDKGLTPSSARNTDIREVGRIDLLCKDKEGSRVVVELKKGRIGHEVVGQTLKYVGWIQKNLDKKARGIIIVSEPDDKLHYATLTRLLAVHLNLQAAQASRAGLSHGSGTMPSPPDRFTPCSDDGSDP